LLRGLAGGAAAAAAAALLVAPAPGGRVVQLPAGVIELREAMQLGSNVEVYGSPKGTVLRMAAGFANGAAMIAGDHVYLHDFTIDGNRDALEARQGLPPWNQPFTGFTRGSGIAVEGRRGVTIRDVRIRNVAGFAILVSRSRDVAIDRVRVEDSGGHNEQGRNNTTGGILLEEGTTDFRVTRCELARIGGNGIWTHSLYTSPRNARGVFEGNRFDTIGRDALQAGHATAMRVEGNWGERIGYPAAEVDATPVAVDTAGNVDASVYAGNRFRDIDGKCIDLDGFHDGEVRGNVCAKVSGYGIVMNNSNPDMQSSGIRIVENLIDGAGFGAVFVIGRNHLVARNRLLNLNTRHCNDAGPCYYAAGEPDMLRSGVYLGTGAERPAPARGNTIEGNEITGYGMAAHCVGSAPAIGPDLNTVRGNRCR
jgi:hypothetical protein